MKVNVYTYTAHKNPKEAYALVKKEGYDCKIGDYNQLAQCLASMVDKQREKGLEKLATVHPDKELFMPAAPATQKNCIGCEGYKSADATTTTDGKKFTLSEKTVNLMIVAGAGVFTISMIVILLKKIK